jgi:two-component system chemotaxis sensor kinase CheA
VTGGGDRYAIPQVSLLELVRLEGEQARRGIEKIHGVPVYRLRGKLLPLVYLHRELGVDTVAAKAGQESVNLVVLQADDRPFGLVVEGINDTEEIVVKPLSKPLKSISLFAGATLMGDGKVALILDVLGLAQRASVVSETRARKMVDLPASASPNGTNQEFVVFRLANGRRMALPLSQVARLERIPRADLEQTASQQVVQYRGQILPMIHLAQHFPGGPSDGFAHPDPLQVLVYSAQSQSAGLVVDHIIDIVEVETKLEVGSTGKRRGILGSAVIQERVTDLLDVPALLGAAESYGALQPATT